MYKFNLIIILIVSLLILIYFRNYEEKFTDLEKDLPLISEIDFSKFKPEIINPNKKIAFVYLYTPNISSYAQHSIKNLTYYVITHGYTLIIYNELFNEDVVPCWNKVIAILANLKSYDYIVWFDADAIISNPNIRIENFIKSNPEKDLLICYDCEKEKECINSGIMIIANTDWAYDLFKKTWESPIPHLHNDQNVLYYVILSEIHHDQEFKIKYPEICNDDVHPKVQILSENNFNCHITNYNSGDFIIHLMGLDTESRINIMRQINTVLGLDNYEPSECINALNKYGISETTKDLRDKYISEACYIKKFEFNIY